MRDRGSDHKWEWNGWKNGMTEEWNGMEWNGMEWTNTMEPACLGLRTGIHVG